MSENPNDPGYLPPAPADAPDPGTPEYDATTQSTQTDPVAEAEIDTMTSDPGQADN